MAKINDALKILHDLPANVLIGLIHCYRYVAGGLLGRCCRFEPSCSLYAMEAIRTYGFMKGFVLTLKRLVRCQPWHPGGIDKVP